MGKGRRRFLNYLLYTKMAKKDYSVEDKLALLEEAKQFFKDYWYLDERLKAKWKPVLLMSELIKWEKDTESRKERLDVVIGFVESLQLEDEYADWVRSWLWLLVGIFTWNKEVIDAFKEVEEITKEKAKLEKEVEEQCKEDKEKAIADITAEIKIYFNK